MRGFRRSELNANQPGYDLLAANPENGKSIEVQVKSRMAVDSGGGVKVASIDFDFVVFVRLNRRTKASLRLKQLEGTLAPEVFVVPRVAVEDAGLLVRKFRLSAVAELQTYKDAWHLISTALA